MGSNRNVAVGQVGSHRRRGAVVVQTAISLTTIMGFAALTVDVGAMYRVRGELQRAADAAALAAAAELGDYTNGNPMVQARTIAQQYVSSNKVLGRSMIIDDSDVSFGRAYFNAAGKCVFETDNNTPNAIKVRVRCTSGSPNGAVPLFFANVFGIRSTNIAASATATLTPRDIVFVMDLSASHNDDSSLVHYRLTDINNRKVWENLWDGALGTQPVAGGFNSGPTFGNMTDWGANTTGPGWSYAADTGLSQLKRGTAWTLGSSWASKSLAAWRATQSASVQAQHPAAYTTAEMNVINSATGAGTETSTSNSTQKANYRRRVLVALGIYRWNSGKSGGQQGGNGDSVIDASEVSQMVPFPSSASNPSTKSKKIGGSWDGFVDYVSDISTSDSTNSNTGLSSRFLKYDPSNSYYGNPALRWRFGLKTLVDYPQDQYPHSADSPGLAGNSEQPMGAVSDAVKASISIIKDLKGNDLIGTAAYGDTGYGPPDKPSDLSALTDDYDAVSERISKLQAGMWTNNTNIANGIDKGQHVLFDSAKQRKNAAKIMILLTDGIANMSYSGSSSTSQAKADTITWATNVRNQALPNHPVRIYTISVGADSDEDLMQQVADIGKGETFHAGGDVATYQATLQEIFEKLGGKRPVMLIQ